MAHRKKQAYLKQEGEAAKVPRPFADAGRLKACPGGGDGKGRQDEIYPYSRRASGGGTGCGECIQ
ncbi:hypothetical protein H6B11_05550 [Mediterraneibacter glycyrrhizinilyticus]|nr:hypothetical protein [Mediterraneibacter glycyrrhizinilyticus]MBM6853627.1 hypothetical protein [Mediterraneibacter glycyrrhizinilyticus]